MCNFPNIQYVDNFVPLNNLQGLPRSPKGMYTFLINRNFVPVNFLQAMNVANMTQLEDVIFQKIQNYQGSELELKEIFCLIHIWGGNRGASVFRNYPNPDMNAIIPHYKKLVNICLSTPIPNNNTLESALDAAQKSITDVYNAIISFHGTIKGIGPSFLTKHTRFWLTKNNPLNQLPIYDSTFAEHIMGYNSPCSPQFNDIIPFWRCMITKANVEHVSLLSLERQLFNYWTH